VRHRDVPRTSAIDELPLTPGGMVVPYTTIYFQDGQDPTAVRRLPTGGHILHCSCEFGRGRAQLGKPCPHRQRKAMIDRLCVICGKPVSQTTVGVFVGVERNTVEGYGEGPFTSIEPIAHRLCAAYSALTCPHLGKEPDKVPVAITRSFELRQKVVIPVPGTDWENKAALLPMGMPIILGALDIIVAIPQPDITKIMTLDEWMQIAPQPYRGLWAAR
jgi:hypothetical protein